MPGHGHGRAPSLNGALIDINRYDFLLIAGSESFLNASEGETIEFGTPKYGIVNYSADYAEQWFLIVPGGRRIQITFEAFELEQSENCKNAYVEIREAYFDDGPTEHDIEVDYGVILAERMCGSSLPKQIQSSADMAWVQFKSTKNSATTYKGFKASFKASRYHGRITQRQENLPQAQ